MFNNFGGNKRDAANHDSMRAEEDESDVEPGKILYGSEYWILFVVMDYYYEVHFNIDFLSNIRLVAKRNYVRLDERA